MKILAIIPARKGSKGVPGKNKMIFDGISLIEYSIETALGAKLLDKIIVSSDDDDILSLSSKYSNQKILFHARNNDLSTDESPIVDTIIELLKIQEINFDYIMVLQPTAPLRKSSDIDKSIQIIISNKNINSLVSVIPMDDIHPARMYWKSNDSILESIMPQYQTRRRQDIPKAYYRNGCIYISKISKLIENNEILNKPISSYEMRYEDWLNIDDKRDVLLAKGLIPEWNQRERKK